MESQQGQVPGAAEAREAVQARSAARRRGSPTTRTATTSCSSSTGRTRTRATTRARRFPSTTRCTRRSTQHAAGPGARQALPGDDAHPRGVRAAPADGQPLPQPAHPAARRGLSQAPDPARRRGSTSTSRTAAIEDERRRRRPAGESRAQGGPSRAGAVADCRSQAAVAREVAARIDASARSARREGGRSCGLTSFDRLWQMIPTMLGVVLLVFVLFNWSAAIRPTCSPARSAIPEQIDNIRRQLGVDQPYYVQLGIFVKQIADRRLRRVVEHQREGVAHPGDAPRAVADRARAAARSSRR